MAEELNRAIEQRSVRMMDSLANLPDVAPKKFVLDNTYDFNLDSLLKMKEELELMIGKPQECVFENMQLRYYDHLLPANYPSNFLINTAF